MVKAARTAATKREKVTKRERKMRMPMVADGEREGRESKEEERGGER